MATLLLLVVAEPKAFAPTATHCAVLLAPKLSIAPHPIATLLEAAAFVLFVKAFTPKAVLLVEPLFDAANTPNEVLVVPILPAAVLFLLKATSTLVKAALAGGN